MKRARRGINSRDGGITFQTVEKHVKAGADLNGGWAAFGVVDVLKLGSRYGREVSSGQMVDVPQYQGPASTLGSRYRS